MTINPDDIDRLLELAALAVLALIFGMIVGTLVRAWFGLRKGE